MPLRKATDARAIGHVDRDRPLLAARGAGPALLAAAIASAVAAILLPLLHLATGAQDGLSIALAGITFALGSLALASREVSRRTAERHAVRATTDPLTGLLHRQGLEDRADAVVIPARVSGRVASVVLFDVDDLRGFNREHGAVAGDDALCRVAAILESQSRDIDLVARLDSDAFAVLLPGAAAVDAKSYAERIGWALGSESIDRALRIAVSSGVASTESVEDDELAVQAPTAAMLVRAQAALVAAKAAGRSRAAWWAEDAIEVGDRIDVPDVEVGASAVPLRPREYVVRRGDRMTDRSRAARTRRRA